MGRLSWVIWVTPIVIMRPLGGEDRKVRIREKDLKLLTLWALRMEEGATSQGMWANSRS